MEIKVGLLVFAAGSHSRDYSILLKKRPDFYYEIPSRSLPDNKDGVSIVCEIVKDFLGISANWDELDFRQVGVFDAVDRNPLGRELFIAYNMFIPAKIKCSSECAWIKVEELSNQKLYMDNEDIIRYSILGGNNVF